MHWADLWREFLRGDPAAVEALGTWATVAVAIIAAGFVWWQIRQASRTALEQAQPNVVAVMQSNPDQFEVIEVAIKNYGQTPARDVVVTMTPPLQRVGIDAEAQDVWVPPVIPYLAPGEEWRTVWDYGPRRAGSRLDFPLQNAVEVTYSGLGRKRRVSTALFDWTPHLGRRYIDRYSVHHAANALRGLERRFERVLEEGGRHVRVMVRDGEARDQAERDGRSGRSGSATVNGAWRTRAGRVRRAPR